MNSDYETLKQVTIKYLTALMRYFSRNIEKLRVTVRIVGDIVLLDDVIKEEWGSRDMENSRRNICWEFLLLCTPKKYFQNIRARKHRKKFPSHS